MTPMPTTLPKTTWARPVRQFLSQMREFPFTLSSQIRSPLWRLGNTTPSPRPLLSNLRPWVTPASKVIDRPMRGWEWGVGAICSGQFSV